MRTSAPFRTPKPLAVSWLCLGIVVFLGAMGLASHVATAASFDCARATKADETAVCSNPKLSNLDALLGKAFSHAASGSDADDRAKARSDARLFLARRRGCGHDVQCLTSAYVGVIEDLESDGSELNLPPIVSALDMVKDVPAETRTMPSKEGQCSRTRVKDIGGRLEGDTDSSSGSSIDLSNGGSQVSYEKVAAIVASRKDDPVLMCLTSIPKNCPPGDGRGRMYTVTNLRTKATWSLPDSQHICGGA